MTPIEVAIDARLIGGSSTGDSTYWTCLVDSLTRIGPEIRLLLFSNAPAPATIPKASNIVWKMIPAKSSRWWSYVAFPLAARRAGAQVVHTQYSLSPLTGRRGITTIHDVSFLIDPTWFRPRDRFILTQTVPASTRRARAVITVSDTSKSEIERLIPAGCGKVHRIYNACPPWIYPLDRSDALASVRNRFGVDRPYLLAVGTRWPRKNFQLAVDAYSAWAGSDSCDLVVTGKSGWGEEKLGPGVRAVGYVDARELSALYSGASLYVIPAKHEGFGITMLEAWRCGAPVLCSCGGALPEVAGDAAFVERSWSGEAWADSIDRLLKDAGTLSEMRSRGYEREKTFSWDEAAAQTLAVYRSVAS